MENSSSRPLLPFSVQMAARLSDVGRVEIEGVQGPARAAVIADQVHLTGSPFLVIVKDEDEARRLADDLRFFMGDNSEDHEFSGKNRVGLLLPDDATPYDTRRMLAFGRRKSELAAALFVQTQNFRPQVLVTSAWGAMRLYPPRAEIKKAADYLSVKAEIQRAQLLKRLVEGGYRSTQIVEDVGDFNVRGSIIDIFCPLYSHPLRLDFWGDEIESIRLFEPSTQKSLENLQEAFVCPVRELVLTPESRDFGRERIESVATEQGSYDRHVMNMLKDLDEGLYSPELDRFLPLFYRKMESVFDYLPHNAMIFIDSQGEVADELVAWQEKLEDGHDEHVDAGDAVLETPWHAMQPDQVTLRMAPFPLIESQGLRYYHQRESDEKNRAVLRLKWEDHSEMRAEIAAVHGRSGMLNPLLTRIKNWHEDGMRIFVAADNQIAAERFISLMNTHQIRCFNWECSFPEAWRRMQVFPQEPEIQIVSGELSEGQVWPEAGLALLREGELFARRRTRREKVQPAADAWIGAISELEPGDYLVHGEYGIGIYRGLVVLEHGGISGDFIHIEYQGGDKLYLPVTQLDKIHKYAGAESKVPSIDRIGGQRWIRGKARAKEAVRKLAAELVKVQAKRLASRGFAFSPPDEYFRQFEAAFPYDETPDQERVIKEVLDDMQQARPMDRLVCGDVGFGKTEVAMRAAFKAVMDGKQVAVLTPTTVLALQHTETFRERMKRFPVTIEMLSRLRTPHEQKLVLDGLKGGKIDIVIGTHKLLSGLVKFANLGLLVIDEEHRFGVAHKERIKQMSSNIDVLTMTATPIPRTLNMAFSQLRDLSIIQTAPVDRLAIRTYISPFSEETIREAIMAELSRGGQVYFIHNRVKSIKAVAELIKRLVPAARVAVAHGQMAEGHLEKVMIEFVRRETNVLVSTAIIESGIDIPNVNTIIINRADTFGLAQLYQLRGRVGRSGERAYAWLLVPSRHQMTKDAEQRLSVLMRFTDLGAGFRIASHDLEIRGAGNLLGQEQSGHIDTVGVELFMQLVDEAVRELKGDEVPSEFEPEINLPWAAFIPEDYISEMSQRLGFYKRFSRARDEAELDGLLIEMNDRFGRPPAEINNLKTAIELKILMRRICARRFDLGRDSLSISLGDQCRLDPQYLVLLVQQSAGLFKLTPELKLFRRFLPDEKKDPVGLAKKILLELAEYGT